MDCCLRTRASSVVGMRWIISEALIEWQQGRMYQNSTYRSGYRVGFWIRQHLVFECNCRRWAKHDFSTIVKSEYRGNQIQEDIFRFLLIIWSQALAHCFRFLAGWCCDYHDFESVSTQRWCKAWKKFLYQVLHWSFFFLNVKILGVLVFYRVAILPIENVSIIKNF